MASKRFKYGNLFYIYGMHLFMMNHFWSQIIISLYNYIITFSVRVFVLSYAKIPSTQNSKIGKLMTLVASRLVLRYYWPFHFGVIRYNKRYTSFATIRHAKHFNYVDLLYLYLNSSQSISCNYINDLITSNCIQTFHT